MDRNSKAEIISKTSHARPLAGLLTSAALLLLAGPALAQEFSYDGNRWYEVEVSIFTHSPLNSSGEEVRLPERTQLSYPDRLRQLTPAISSYLIDFEQEEAPPDTRELHDFRQADSRELGTAGTANTNMPFQDYYTERGTQDELQESELYGPEYRPPGEDFRLIDFSKDPFVSLPPDYQELTSLWRKLESSSEHRLLYQATWRQPVFGPGQSSAVFVRGGQRRGEHNELEGSVRVSLSGNRLEFDANLWLNTFNIVLANVSSLWQVPPQPFPASTDEEVVAPQMGNWLITEVAHLQQSRSMRSETLHYLDHPAFGVLVQMRPYTLPDDFSLGNLE